MHGTISKAGKVRKQTPIVETKEIFIKKKVGRAKKRIQYNRKFNILNMGSTGKLIFQPNKQK